MPKIKTNRAAKKRFTLTATGKVKRRHGYLRHINTHMTSKRKRHLRQPTLVDKADERNIKRLLPYGQRRPSKETCMPRVKGGPKTRRRHKKIIKAAKRHV